MRKRHADRDHHMVYSRSASPRCVLCNDVITVDHRTNITENVNCECECDTVHWDCLNNHFRESAREPVRTLRDHAGGNSVPMHRDADVRNDGHTRRNVARGSDRSQHDTTRIVHAPETPPRKHTKCPACGFVCVSYYNMWSLFLDKVSTALLYLVAVNVVIKLPVPTSLLVLAIGYNVLYSVLNWKNSLARLNGRGCFNTKMCKALKIKRVVWMCIFLKITQSWGYLAHEAESMSYVRCGFGPNDVPFSDTVHRSIIDEMVYYQANFVPGFLDQTLWGCITGTIMYHLVFEFQLKLYLYVLLQTMALCASKMCPATRFEIKTMHSD